MLKSLDSKYVMMFLVPLMCLKYRDISSLKSVQYNHCNTISWPPLFTGSKDSLCIHRRALELSVKSRTWDPCPSCWISMQIENYEARNSSGFSVSKPCHLGGMYQLQVVSLLLYPSIPYPQASVLDSGYSSVRLIMSLQNYGYLHARSLALRRGKNVGTLCSMWNVEMGICPLDWVCSSFSLVIPIGKSNTPLLRMYSCFFGFEKVSVCVLVSTKS